METVHDSNNDLHTLFGRVKGEILTELSYSERSMDELSALLKINKNAVKDHMENLELKGYVKSFFRGEGPGRPRKYYELTEKGMNLLPKKYVSFATMLVGEIENEFGRDKVNEILGNVADKIVTESGWVKAQAGLNLSREDKISKLRDFVSTLNELGYYARLEITDDVVRIIRHNCIFYELAKNNDKIICTSLGSNIIKNSINQKFDIKEKFSDGNNKCVVEVNIE